MQSGDTINGFPLYEGDPEDEVSFERYFDDYRAWNRKRLAALPPTPDVCIAVYDKNGNRRVCIGNSDAAPAHRPEGAAFVSRKTPQL